MSDGDESVCRLCANEVADGQRLFAGDKGGADDTGCADVIFGAVDLSQVQRDQLISKLPKGVSYCWVTLSAFLSVHICTLYVFHPVWCNVVLWKFDKSSTSNETNQ